MYHVNKFNNRRILSSCLVATWLSVQAVAGSVAMAKQPEHAGTANKPTHSSPIALSKNNKLVWSVNPDSDSVSVVRTDTRQLVARIAVGDEPRSIALTADDRYAYVANAAGNNVVAIRIENGDPDQFKASLDESAGLDGKLTTGAEPRGIVGSPDGKRVFVANSSQDTITVINALNRKIIGNVDLRNSVCNSQDINRHYQPRGMAVTEDSKFLYVTRFLSFTGDNGVQGKDHGKVGLVCRLNIDTNSLAISGYVPTQAIPLKETDSGFADKNGNPTYAFPNQLQSIVIRDGKAYLPNIAASPTGPLRFDNDTQAYVNQIDGVGGNETDAGAINLHLGARVPEAGKPELYFANPWGIAFSNGKGAGSAYVISAGSDFLVKLDVAADGTLKFTGGDATTRYIDLNDPDNSATSGDNAGKNPIGVAIDDAGKTAYVLNYVSRNLSVVDLSTDRVVKVVRTDSLPLPGSHDEVVAVGAELFFSSRGNFVSLAGATGSSRNRLSEKGHQNCASCHADGLTDGVIWQYNSGPRKTIAINGTFNPRNLHDQRIINASAVFDEVEDADFNSRRVSSGEPLAAPLPCVDVAPFAAVLQSTNDPAHGLILGEEYDFEFAPCVLNPFARPNANRPQARVQLPGSSVQVKALDAFVEWQRSAIRSPNRPLTREELLAGGGDASGGLNGSDVREGEWLFVSANCQSCHGGGQWTKSRKDFVSPPNPAEIATEAGAPNANQQQFLPRFLTDIGSYNLNVAGSGNAVPGFPLIGGIEKDTNNRDGLGFDFNGDGKGAGFTAPSLLSTYNIPPYYHNGACETLECVLADVKHHRAGLASGQADPLDSAEARSKIVNYLQAIDEKTNPQFTMSEPNTELEVIEIGTP